LEKSPLAPPGIPWEREAVKKYLVKCLRT